MTKYIIRRILLFIPVLIGVIFTVFLLVRIIPGGPFDFVGDKSLPPQVVANLEEKYHINDPIWKQFIDYLWDLISKGDLGPSFKYRGRTVNEIIKETLPISFQLGLLSMILAIIIGIPTGIIAALKQNSVFDYSSTFIAVVFRSIPNMALGPLLIWLIALKLGWLPVARWGALPPFFLGFIPKINADFFKHAMLPTFALGTAYSAGISRLTRGSLLQVIREDYIRTARAKGLSERMVIVGHALKNGLIPVITYIGPIFAAVLTGTFIVEHIFGIPGMGKHFIKSIGNRDYAVIQGVTLVYSITLVVANLLVDITYAWLDPRIRYA
ncbi:MAG: ABC transporter permease [Actinomycetia bacterium]|nr:ABC transporter permease [Actinomycetes bacterium]